MDKDLQKIDQKIDKLAEAVTKGFSGVDKRFMGLEEKIEDLTEVVVFMKDRMVTKDELKEEVAKLATKEELNGKFKMLEGHMNVIEQKLDTHIEKQSDLEVRTTRLESKSFAK